MKIDDGFSQSGASPLNDLRSPGVGQTPETRAPARAQGPGAGKALDQASLSALGVQISRALEQDTAKTVARIGQLQQAVANGTYSVPSSAVSPKIVDSSLELTL